MALSAHKTAPQNSAQTMRYYPFGFLPERMRTACDRSGANGNGASSRGTRRTDNARGQLETGRFLFWIEDVAAQSERRASLLAFPSQSCVGAANRLQAFMERGDEGDIATYYNYSAEGEWVKYGFFRSCHWDLLCVRLPLLPARRTTSTQLRDNEQVTPFWFRLSFG